MPAGRIERCPDEGRRLGWGPDALQEAQPVAMVGFARHSPQHEPPTPGAFCPPPSWSASPSAIPVDSGRSQRVKPWIPETGTSPAFIPLFGRSPPWGLNHKLLSNKYLQRSNLDRAASSGRMGYHQYRWHLSSPRTRRDADGRNGAWRRACHARIAGEIPFQERRWSIDVFMWLYWGAAPLA